LTAARAEYEWLAAGSQTVQQQALSDFAQAMRNFLNRTHRRPTWRKAGQHEGFHQVGVKARHIQRLSRRCGQVWMSSNDTASCGPIQRVANRRSMK
jgi:putative transposase